MKTVTIPHPAGPLTVTCHPAAADDLLARSKRPDWSVERYGQWTCDWFEAEFYVAGRLETNLEMHAHAAYRLEQAKLKREQTGCCGSMMSMGECWECGGVCPVFLKVRELLHQIEGEK